MIPVLKKDDKLMEKKEISIPPAKSLIKPVNPAFANKINTNRVKAPVKKANMLLSILPLNMKQKKAEEIPENKTNHTAL